MKINSVNTYSPSFTSCARTKYKMKDTGKVYTSPNYYYDPAATLYMLGKNSTFAPVKIVSSNYTTFFRDDVPDWSRTAKTLGEAFKDTDKVNVYNYACSDGSEPYSLAISLIENLGEDEAEKFFPIQAFDIDQVIINKAKKGEMSCSKYDMQKINENSSGKFDKYFKKMFDTDNEGAIIKPQPYLKNKVKFERSNFTKDVQKIETKNNLILCRNFWRYLPNDKASDAIIALRHLDEGTRFMFGDFDAEDCSSHSLPYVFRYAGLSEGINRVYSLDSRIVNKFTDEQILNFAKNGIYRYD